ncbi:GGDEF domain-containing protein [Caldimonas tepidiphila]|uniref:GGDEF domain-containing protein n=1 Tax=Caldimonas tepidiphila TaxID=2315841 RepID=UPI001300A1F2|nr:GGDEF domain-containing protein [Caldimonas tepidiphila]
MSPISAAGLPGGGPADSPFARISRLMRRGMALFWLFAALLGVLVAHQFRVQQQAAERIAQSREAFGDITQLRMRMSDLLAAVIMFEHLQNPELFAPRIACGALCEHLPRLARHVDDRPEMHETVRRAMVWDARLAASLREALLAADRGVASEEVAALVAHAREVELPQLRRKIDEIALSEVQTLAARQMQSSHTTLRLLAALFLMTLGTAATAAWLHRQGRRIAQEGLHAEQAVLALALEDPLTGLPNRRMLAESGALLLHRARRQQQAVALMLVDLDGFKQVNDAYGHAAGDALLRDVGARMRETLREGDLLVRLGGDEFVVLLDGSASAAEVLRVGQRLVEAVGRPVALPGGAQATVSASIGLACFPADSERLEGLLAAADEALYSAKRAGKNRLCRAGRDSVAHVLRPEPPSGGSTPPLQTPPLNEPAAS